MAKGKRDWEPLTPAKQSVSDSAKASNEAKNETPRRRNEGKRLKIKRHRPKVFDKTKTKKSTPKLLKPSTPKPRTPKRPKPVENNSLNKTSVEPPKDVERKEAGDSTATFCRRKLDFVIENYSTNQNTNVCGEIESKPEVETKKLSSLLVYTRIFRCLKSSRKLGPNCPFVFKKARTRRPRATVFDKFIRMVRMIPEFIRLVRMIPTTQNEPINLDRIVRERRTKPRTSSRIRRKVTSILRRKRSLTISRKRDLSFFVNDMSKLLFSETFLSKASTIRSRDTGTELEDHMLGVEMGPPDLNSNIGIPSYRSEQPSDSDVETPSPVALSDEEEDVRANQVYDMFTRALLDFSTQKLAALNDDRSNQLVVRNQNVELTHFKAEPEPVKKLELTPKIDLDAETIREYNLLMGNGGNKETEEDDEEKEKYWEQERALYESRLDKFIAIMRLIQGDKSFSPWKGSIVDSVVGVFLTQNVSDHLSSSAFMTLAARYPPPPVTSEHNDGSGESVRDNDRLRITEPPSDELEQLLMVVKDLCNQSGVDLKNENVNSFLTQSTSGRKNGKNRDKQETVDWDELRKKYSPGIPKARTDHTVDSVDWEAVRQTPVNELAKVIVARGMNNLLARRIKDFLDRLVRDHGSIDLEWLRDVPPDEAKEYLLSIPGLGLKSVECVRLLALHHPAFPVDVNISRVTTRNDWIPLLPLPEGVMIHDLNQFPDLDSVQKFLWPRIKHISHAKLYEAHCHLILFGKAICTKKQPNCNACPLTANCKHYASMCASAKPRLEGSHDENMTTESSPASSQELPAKTSRPMLPYLNGDDSAGENNSRNCEPIIEMPASPEHDEHIEKDMDVCTQTLLDIEDFGCDDEMPTLKLNGEEFSKKLKSFREGGGYDVAKAVVPLGPHAQTMPKLKNVQRLRTVHHVYELPDSHPLLAGPKNMDNSNNCQESTKCDTCTCSGETVKYQNEHFVQGTILIPCRSANRGSFPLNGTYFQINEVFADHESSQQPIDIPREWVWDLKRHALYCGTSVHSICKGMSMEEIRHCLVKGFICIRGFDKITGGPKPLIMRFHMCKTRRVDNEL